MPGSMLSAISGLRGRQVLMDVIHNTTANVNTLGSKSGRVNFTDILSQQQSQGSEQSSRGNSLPPCAASADATADRNAAFRAPDTMASTADAGGLLAAPHAVSRSGSPDVNPVAETGALADAGTVTDGGANRPAGLTGAADLTAADIGDAGAGLPAGYELLPGGGCTSDLTGVGVGGVPSWQVGTVGTSDAPPPLTAPSNDTVGLLNQYIFAYKNWGNLAEGTSCVFLDQSASKGQIVQLMSSILWAGPSYFGGGGYALSSADVALAQKLASETNSQMNYNPEMLAALDKGLAGFPQNFLGVPGPGLAGTSSATISTDAITVDAGASRVASLEASIEHETLRVAKQTAKGNKKTAGFDLASLNKYKAELAALTK